jgi:hypothetical protein
LRWVGPPRYDRSLARELRRSVSKDAAVGRLLVAGATQNTVGGSPRYGVERQRFGSLRPAASCERAARTPKASSLVGEPLKIFAPDQRANYVEATPARVADGLMNATP